MSSSPPVIGFELGVGEFRIVTPEAIYQIKVLPELVTANMALGVVSPTLGAAPSHSPAHVAAAPVPSASNLGHSPNEQVFFQEISQELFEKVGQLARQLSVSVGEIPEVPQGDLSKTGADLENAKGQLEEVVELTEKASMTIMDLADQIQLDMDSLNSQMTSLTNLEFLLEGEAGKSNLAGSVISSPAAAALPVDFLAKLGELKNYLARFVATAQAPSESPLEVEPELAVQGPILVFDLDVVFQTLYEFCTNEQVKEHIKNMRDDNSKGLFNRTAVEAELSKLAASLTPDDGFYNFPIAQLLKLLYTNTSNETHKTTLKKMHQTATSIFLEANLPVEGTEALAQAPAPPKHKPVEVQVSAAAAAAGEQDFKAMLELTEYLETLAQSPPMVEGGQIAQGSLVGIDDGFTAISFKDRDTIIKTVENSEKLITNTTKHLTRIMEALSFQDLSGQRIKKIVGLISDVQVQLLSVLVSVNTKLKAHTESPATVRPKEESEKVAQAEVDRMLEKLQAEPSELKGPGAENRLDQGAVNDLLAQLGF